MTNKGTSVSSISATLTTGGPNESIYAFLTADGSQSSSQSALSIAGGGLTWRLVGRANAQPGTAEIWQAFAPTPLNRVKIVATLALRYQAMLQLTAFKGASASPGASAARSATTGAPTVVLTTSRPNSLVWAAGQDWEGAVPRVAGPGQSIVSQYLAPAGDTFWTQKFDAAVSTMGTVVTINDTSPTEDCWNLIGVEIPAA